MKILQVNNSECITGGSDRVYQLTSGLLADKGHDVATLACGTEGFDSRKRTYLLPKNTYIERNPITTLRNIKDFVSRRASSELIESIINEFKPDIIHLHIFYGQISSSILSRIRANNVPCVMTMHEYRMLCPVSTLFNERSGACEKCAEGDYIHAVLNRCNRGSLSASMLSAFECTVRDRRYDYLSHIDHFFMVSKFCQAKHVEYLPEIAAKSSVLYNFVDVPSSRDDVNDQNILNRPRSYLYAGRLAKEKGLDLLCEEFANCPGQILKIAGDGPLALSLRTKYGQCPNIRFLGKLGAEELKTQLSQAWFSVVPSEWYENNPMSILESFAVKTPVVAARIGGIPELVKDGLTGLLFEASDAASLRGALERAAKMSETDRSTLAQNCYRHVANHHSVETHYRQLLSGYETVIAKKLRA